MQEESKQLYTAIGKILYEKRKELGIKYTDFCYENDIPTSTYDAIISGTSQASFYNIAKVVKALNMNFEDFGKLLDKNLPQNFMNLD